MGKRKNKEKEANISKRLKRIERYLRRSYSPDSSDGSHHRSEHRSRSRTPLKYHPRSTSRCSDSRSPLRERYGSRSPSIEENWIFGDGSRNERRKVHSPEKTQKEKTVPLATEQPGASTSTETDNILPQDILEALGDPKGKEEVFGPKIPDEISKCWGRVLVDGLTKEEKQEMLEKTLVPENFQLVKAPLLNPEISAVLSDPIRNRDKLLEKAQNHLGLGIAGLTNFAASLIEGEMSKLEILKKISDINQIFLDLHHENTNTRRKLAISSLDKKFVNIIADVKRDSYLFGANLGEKIKATKTAERSGLQIRRAEGSTASTSRKYPQQGNWKGPPRSYIQRAQRSGGPRNRYANAPSRRPPPGAARQSAPGAKQTAKPRKH